MNENYHIERLPRSAKHRDQAGSIDWDGKSASKSHPCGHMKPDIRRHRRCPFTLVFMGQAHTKSKSEASATWRLGSEIGENGYLRLAVLFLVTFVRIIQEKCHLDQMASRFIVKMGV